MKDGRVNFIAIRGAITNGLLAITPLSFSENISPEAAQMMERTLQDAEDFRKQLSSSEYEATMFIQASWNGEGHHHHAPG